MEKHIFLTHGCVGAEDRESLLGQKGSVLWMTGLSGSGKSTIAQELECALHKSGRLSYVLDGDNVRHGLCSDLGFGDADRSENIRRIAELSKLFADAGLITITAFISPFRKDRDFVRKMVPPGRFVEIFLDVPLEICESRDPKGLYKKARKGEIADFTGISSPYEKPENPEISICTGKEDLHSSVKKIMDYLRERQII